MQRLMFRYFCISLNCSSCCSFKFASFKIATCKINIIQTEFNIFLQEVMSMVILFSYLCLCMGFQNCAASYLKLCMFMDVFSPLSAKDKFSFICHTNQVVLHGVTQQPRERVDRYQPTGILQMYLQSLFTYLIQVNGCQYTSVREGKMSDRCLAIS